MMGPGWDNDETMTLSMFVFLFQGNQNNGGEMMRNIDDGTMMGE